MKKVILWVFLGLALGAGSVAGIDQAIKKGIVLYHPDMSLPTPQEAGVPAMMSVVVDTSDNLKLVSWFSAPTDPKKQVMLFFMGDTGGLADRVSDFKPYLENGYGIFLLGYRGFGGNPGKPSERGLYRDARGAIEWLAQHGYKHSQIVLYGHSLGTGIAVQMATEIKAYAVVLEAPYTTLPDTVELNVPFAPANWFMKDRYDNMSKIAKIRSPLLVLQGDQDEVIPEKQGKALYKAAPSPKVAHFIPNGGHTDLYDYGAAKLVMAFLEKLPEQ